MALSPGPGSVKEELRQVLTDENCLPECTVPIKMELEFVGERIMKIEPEDVKVEIDSEGTASSWGVSEAASRAELYAGHTVKDELVVGPEVLQPADVVFARPVESNVDVPASGHDMSDSPSDQAASIKDEPTNHIYSCEICKNEFVSKDNMRSCEICSGDFLNLSRLRGHMEIQSDSKPYSCGTCELQFTYKISLQQHELFHNGLKPFSCAICNRDFKDRDTLTRHERVHSGDKPYSCDMCTKQFADAGSRKKHERVHTGVKPYFCEICDKRFSDMGELRRHVELPTHLSKVKTYFAKRPSNKLKVKKVKKVKKLKVKKARV